MKKSKPQKGWTSEEIARLQILVEDGLSYTDIGVKLGRTSTSVEHAIRRYGIAKKIARKDDLFLGKRVNPRKLTYKDLNELSRYIGSKLVEGYEVVKLKEPKLIKYKERREEVSILDISDVHIGMVNTVFDSQKGTKIVTYNMEIFEKELTTLQDSIFQIHEILRNSYKLRKLVVFMLGDIITNDRIFKEQAFEVEKVVGLQIWDGVAYFAQFFNNLLRIYEEIEVVCVVGNHGRSLPDSYEEPVENNFEYHLYKILEKQFEKSKRIKIIVPASRRYIYPVFGWKHLIEHGDSLRGFTDNSIEKQIKELSLNIGGFDVMHFGHVHKLKEREIADKVIVKQNGCWIEKDSYAFKKFKTYSVPKQHFFGCNEKRAETWAYKIDLRG
ncbi:MAG: hypothetical protein ACTSPD_10250 [Promethearchaeota archaeon]